MKKNILEEWLNYIGYKENDRVTPNDNLTYKIAHQVVKDTIEVLREYGRLKHEGLIYWAGYIEGNNIIVTSVIAPETQSSEGRVTINPESNFFVVKELSKKRIIHIGQVHSHPGSWVDHSKGDNEWASFKRDGLLSIVVPNYCKDGILPFQKCGIHRFFDQKFLRLSNRYIKQHFEIINIESFFIDLRHKENYRWNNPNGIN